MITQRVKDIAPFHVMDILAKAKQLESQGKDIIHMEVGEPDFVTPEPIIKAGIQALEQGKTHYTPALGLPELRQAVADWYLTRYRLHIPASRIVITPGASGALLLLLGALVEQGQQILTADPGYPCNRHFVRFIEGRAKIVPVDACTGYQLTAQHIRQHWDAQTALVLLASPSNPTGTVLSNEALRELSESVKAQQGQLIVDEIYHGLTYDNLAPDTILKIDPDAFVINSFSKYFGMTGWRLGWIVAPEAVIPALDRLAQNLFLAPSTIAQYAALAAFQPETLAILEQRRRIFEQRRDSLLPALTALGLKIECPPQGAFYMYANCQALLNDHLNDSMALCHYWLTQAGVAVTPGHDFGSHHAGQYIRFAYTTTQSRLMEAVERLRQHI